METDNCLALKSPSRIIAGADAEKTAGSLSVFHRVETTDNTGQNVSVFIHLVSNGEWQQIEMTPGCQPDWIASQLEFFQEIWCQVAEKNRIVKGSKCWWCYYFIAVTLCNQHFHQKNTYAQSPNTQSSTIWIVWIWGISKEASGHLDNERLEPDFLFCASSSIFASWYVESKNMSIASLRAQYS